MTDKDKKAFATSFKRLPNKEAERHFNQKSLITSAEFAHFKAYQHALAFTVAGLADKDMLTEIHKAVKGAIDNGTSFNDFKKSLKPFLISKGWLSPELTGDDKADKALLKDYERTLNRRLKTIYHTNKATAYSAGRWERIQKTKDFLPYLQYLPSASVNKRDGHKAYYGIVRPVDDPIWQSIFPPNGFGCKCAVKQITKSKARELGITDDETITELPTPDFDSNFDRLGSLLRLAEDKHGKEFAEKLAGIACGKWLDIDVGLFFKSSGNQGHIFPPDKFQKIVVALKKQGVDVEASDDIERFLTIMQAQAGYVPDEVGKAGYMLFPKHPTRTQVIEEIIHFVQHKRAGFMALTALEIAKMEVQAQQQLLNLGVLLGWTDNELKEIEQALKIWQNRVKELENADAI